MYVYPREKVHMQLRTMSFFTLQAHHILFASYAPNTVKHYEGKRLITTQLRAAVIEFNFLRFCGASAYNLHIEVDVVELIVVDILLYYAFNILSMLFMTNVSLQQLNTSTIY